MTAASDLEVALREQLPGIEQIELRMHSDRTVQVRAHRRVEFLEGQVSEDMLVMYPEGAEQFLRELVRTARDTARRDYGLDQELAHAIERADRDARADALRMFRTKLETYRVTPTDESGEPIPDAPGVLPWPISELMRWAGGES